MVIKEQKTEDTYAYTYETPAEWTPYNSNLQMHGMKVPFALLETETVAVPLFLFLGLAPLSATVPHPSSLHMSPISYCFI